MALTYTQKGDYFYPNLIYSTRKYPPLGKYGMLRKTFLKEHKKEQYNWMVWQNILWPHLLQIDRQATEMMEQIVTQMKQSRGVTEELKANDQWRWIQEMGNIQNAAEEIVLRELVYI